MRVALEEDFSIEPLLAGMGYSPDDLAHRAYWDNKVFTSQGVGVLWGISSVPMKYYTNDNGNGRSQILLNMKDGQIILINVTTTYSFAELLSWFFGAILMNIIIVPFIIFIPWNLYLMFGRVTGLYGWVEKTPVLVF